MKNQTEEEALTTVICIVIQKYHAIISIEYLAKLFFQNLGRVKSTKA